MVTDEHVHRDGLNNNIQSDVPLIMYLVEDTRENICDLVAASNELKQDNMKCLLDYFIAEIEKVLLTMWAVNSSSLTNQYSETRSAQLLACVHWVAMCTVSASDATSLLLPEPMRRGRYPEPVWNTDSSMPIHCVGIHSLPGSTFNLVQHLHLGNSCVCFL